ncbi:MAG: fibronectin type III domain-containing protein [Thermodesulfobacteriota bacterium]|jgi:hypothetical protein
MDFPKETLWRIFVFLFLCPLGIYAEVVAAELLLSWMDQSDDESGFFVERGDSADGPFIQIAVVGENVTSYTDADLVPGATYCYRVRAFNEFAVSPYSNTACAALSTLVATLESHEQGQPVSGITLIRGWAFDTQGGSSVSSVELFLDDVPYGTIPCCAERRDVQAAFPAFPPENTLYSGWGAVLNWGIVNPGAHTLRLKIHNTAGGTPRTETRAVVVVRPGDFEFLEKFDLSAAVASVEMNELLVRRIRVQDRVTLREKEIDARFRWSSRSQSFEMVGAITVAEISAFRSLVSSLLSALSPWFGGEPSVPEAQAAAGVVALMESPQDGQVASGIGIIRGWAFPETQGATLEEVQLLIDGQPVSTIPCCSERGDVAAVFAQHPGASQSGWGVIFNYGLLGSGPHTVGVSFRDSVGAVHTLERRVEVVRPGGFEFLNQFELSGAVVYREGEDIVIQGVWVRDQISQQEKVIDVRLRWLPSTQTLGIVAATG